MKRVMFYSVLVASLALGACNHKADAPKAEEKMSSDAKMVDIKVSQLASNKDLNCDMPLSDDGIADTANYQGKIYGFCSAECKADFLATPDAHLAKK